MGNSPIDGVAISRPAGRPREDKAMETYQRNDCVNLGTKRFILLVPEIIFANILQKNRTLQDAED